MNAKRLLAAALLLPHLAFGASVTGILTSGGGTDDMHIVVKPAGGKDVYAYCDHRCGDLFLEVGLDESKLKKSVTGKKVVLTYRDEKNNDRIAGPGEDGLLTFVKKLEFAR